ncbi:MAG: SDR family oxidoreductase [Deltaproteobacteria bacterium]|nr:SDR family oxidoreductase [Deltaproteobacteria bacterium]
MTTFSLEGKVALVTGASRGIGEAVALCFAEQGAECILASRKAEALERVVEKIEGLGGKAWACAANMGDLAQISDLFAFAEKKFGKLDILVNNAATNPYFGNMSEAPEWAWDKTLAVNLKGPFFAIQEAAKLMDAAGGGAIVNVASINGVKPAPLQGIYSITKAGIISMTKGFAKELAPRRIRVNALLPGLTKTDFSKALFESKEIHQHVVQEIPMQRHAEPQEMSGAVLYLVSEAASFTTGICITCDGGYLA